MENKEEQKNVNLIIKNQEEEEKEIVISVFGIIKNFKRVVALWIAVSIIVSLLTVLVGTLLNIKVYKETAALVSFTYDGIERGLDPNGNKFDMYSIKNPVVLKKAIEKLGRDESEVEKIRSGIVIDGIVPQGVMERLTAYREIVDAGTTSSLAAAERILETTYYPTQFKVSFNYSNCPYSGEEAASILNTILETYSEFFLEKYGYNDNFGTSVADLKADNYDYAELIDIYDSAIDSLIQYLRQLDAADNIHFRSSETGSTFSDLIGKVNTIRDVDMDKMISYITLNVVTKDKDSLKTYYEYRVESLQRYETVCRENLAAVTDSINTYQKNTVQIFGAGTDNLNTTAQEASEEYDKLFDKKLNIQNDLSSTVQKIKMYQTRLERLNGPAVGTPAQKERVEQDIKKLDSDIKELISKVQLTADEFYRTYVYSKAYNILVPASASTTNFIKSAIKDSILIVIAIDVVIFVGFFGYAVVNSCISEYNKKNGKKEKNKKATGK